MSTSKKLYPETAEELIRTLKDRFEKNMNRHKGLNWKDVETKIRNNQEALWSLNELDRTGGEPDVVAFDKKTGKYTFMDCSAETPKDRRNICYDRQALDARKKFKPENSAMDMAKEMGVEMLNEEQYRELQKLGPFDQKTSSWIITPPEVRKLGGALFADYRYGRVFIYHNGADSYYGARSFRAALSV